MGSKEKQGGVKSRLVKSGVFALFTVFTWELLEEGLENLLAYAISSAFAVFITKALSTLAIVTATQGLKVMIKKFLVPIIKKIIYKDGKDKMEKIKKVFNLIKANKCSIVVAIAMSLLVIFGCGIVDINEMPSIDVITQEAVVEVIQEEDVIATEIVYGEPTIAEEIVYEEDGVTIKYNVGDEIPTILYNVGDVITPTGTVLVEGQEEQTKNIAPAIYYGIIALLGLFGIKIESTKAYEQRVALEKANKEKNAITREAKHQIKVEKLEANETQAKKEKAKAKEEAKRIADEKKQKEKDEHDKKVKEEKESLLAEQVL